MNNSMLKRLLSIFIALLLFFYIGYQIYSANYSTVRTETALSKTEADTIETTGIAIRKESLIEQPANGVVAYEMCIRDRCRNRLRRDAVRRLWEPSSGCWWKSRMKRPAC